MLPRAHRMRRSSDFAAAVRRGRRAGRSRLVVHLLSAGTGAPPLVGFVVSRAVGGSVVRNRVERRLRHLAAARLDRLPPGSHLVVRAAPPASAATSAELGEDLDAALRSALAPRRTGRPPAGRPGGSGGPGGPA